MSDHKDEVTDIYDLYKSGEITKEEMVEKVTQEIDVEYVYEILEKYGTEEVKDKISTVLVSLENEGINLYDYIDEETYNKIADTYLDDEDEMSR